ncbi:hypothetical protein BC835DRAFT_1546858 [Cytidiella melzeri]|nr:hypothetical protein BC835DRAFT_1546858 [Cytidiella melzeri]
MDGQQSPPPWPSLYNILIDLQPISGRPPAAPGGFYLDNPSDIYKFTLYWTLVFYTPAFMFCGTYAFVNLAFTPESRLRRMLFLAPHRYSAVPTRSDIPLSTIHKAPSHMSEGTRLTRGRSRLRPNERRSRLTFALLVLFVFACCAVGGAVVGSTVLGYVMAGVFKVAHYQMSTWIPFLLGLMQTLVGFLGIWPSVVDII